MQVALRQLRVHLGIKGKYHLIPHTKIIYTRIEIQMKRMKQNIGMKLQSYNCGSRGNLSKIGNASCKGTDRYINYTKFKNNNEKRGYKQTKKVSDRLGKIFAISMTHQWLIYLIFSLQRKRQLTGKISQRYKQSIHRGKTSDLTSRERQTKHHKDTIFVHKSSRNLKDCQYPGLGM